MSKFVAGKNATLYMVCRNQERAEKAKSDVVEGVTNANVHILLGDCGTEKGVRNGSGTCGVALPARGALHGIRRRFWS